MRLRVLTAILAALAFVAPGLASAEAGIPPPEQGPPTEERDARININEAGVDELVELPGIGPSRAQAIIAEREKDGRQFWVRVGAAFVNRDGSLNVRLDAVPVNGKLQIRDYQPRESRDDSARERAA